MQNRENVKRVGKMFLAESEHGGKIPVKNSQCSSLKHIRCPEKHNC